MADDQGMGDGENDFGKQVVVTARFMRSWRCCLPIGGIRRCVRTGCF